MLSVATGVCVMVLAEFVRTDGAKLVSITLSYLQAGRVLPCAFVEEPLLSPLDGRLSF